MQNKKTEYYSTGEIRSEAYCSTLSNNLIHRNDGPAWILYNKNKNIVEKEYFWYGVIMSFSQWINVTDAPKDILIRLKLSEGEYNAQNHFN